MTREEIADMETDEEVSNRIKECEKDLWTCDESIKDAIYENVSVELLALLRAANKCEDNTSSHLSVIYRLGAQLFEDTEAYLEAQATELETGELPK